jgi:hypothetical protein
MTKARTTVLIANTLWPRLKSLYYVTQESVRENTGMNLIEQIKACIFSHGSMVVIAVIGILALILAMKIAHVIIRMIFALLGLAAIGTAVWWFFLRQ